MFNYTGEITAKDALLQGFNDLIDLCDVVTERFVEARDQFDAKQ